jgi:hypothetical protein
MSELNQKEQEKIDVIKYYVGLLKSAKDLTTELEVDSLGNADKILQAIALQGQLLNILVQLDTAAAKAREQEAK